MAKSVIKSTFLGPRKQPPWQSASSAHTKPRAQSARTQKPSVTMYVNDPSTGRWSRTRKFKAILGYIVSLRPAQNTWERVSKAETNKQKHNNNNNENQMLKLGMVVYACNPSRRETWTRRKSQVGHLKLVFVMSRSCPQDKKIKKKKNAYLVNAIHDKNYTTVRPILPIQKHTSKIRALVALTEDLGLFQVTSWRCDSQLGLKF